MLVLIAKFSQLCRRYSDPCMFIICHVTLEGLYIFIETYNHSLAHDHSLGSGKPLNDHLGAVWLRGFTLVPAPMNLYTVILEILVS